MQFLLLPPKSIGQQKKMLSPSASQNTKNRHRDHKIQASGGNPRWKKRRCPHTHEHTVRPRERVPKAQKTVFPPPLNAISFLAWFFICLSRKIFSSTTSSSDNKTRPLSSTSFLQLRITRGKPKADAQNETDKITCWEGSVCWNAH